MPKLVIEREMPGAGKLGAGELQGASAKACDVLQALGPQIQSMQSYVTNDKVDCVDDATSEGLLREQAAQSGFPADSISAVRSLIDPSTAEA